MNLCRRSMKRHSSPVELMVRFSSVADAIKLASPTGIGLEAYVFPREWRGPSCYPKRRNPPRRKSAFSPPTKNRPGFYPGRSVACLCVEERLIFVIRWPGVRFRVQLSRTHAFFESLAFLPSPSGASFGPLWLLYLQWPCQSPRHLIPCDMLYLGRGSSVTQCPLCDLLTLVAVLAAGRCRVWNRSTSRVVSRSSTRLRSERCSQYSLGGLKPLNAQSNLALTGV